MADLVALLRELVQAELSGLLTSAIGVVEATADHADGDKQNYNCDVRLRGRDVVLTGVPIMTPHLGTVAPPAPGDLVMVQWVGGDGSQPVVAGRFYSDVLRAPAYAAGEAHLLLPPDAAESDRLQLDLIGGKQGSRSLKLQLPSDVTIAVTDAAVEITVKQMTFKLDGDGSEATLKTQKTTVTVKDGGDVTVEAGGNLTLKAQGNVELSAGGNLSLKASGNAELKGSMVALGS